MKNRFKLFKNEILTSMLLLVFVMTGLSLNAQVVDIDNNSYKTTVIGDQVWMAENLKVTHFNNGEPIIKYPPDLPESVTHEEWSLWIQENIKRPLYRAEETGFLYNPSVVSLSRPTQESKNICPTGWHIPTQSDWDQLIETLGGRLSAGVLLKSETGWQDGENGNNETGFNAQPGFDNSHYGPGLQVIWWATQGSRGLVSHETLSDMRNYDGSGMIMNRYGEFEESSWYYIRCVKD